MENLLYDMSCKYQQDFLDYVQNRLQDINIPTLIHHAEEKSFPYIVLSIETEKEFFRGQGKFSLEILLFQDTYSYELDRIVTEKLSILSRAPISLDHEISFAKWNSCTSVGAMGKQHKETKQRYCIRWEVFIVSKWKHSI